MRRDPKWTKSVYDLAVGDRTIHGELVAKKEHKRDCDPLWGMRYTLTFRADGEDRTFKRFRAGDRLEVLGCTYECEASLPVEDFLRRAGGDVDDAFELARDAAEEAGETVLLEVKIALGYERRPPRIRVHVAEFVEFDSSNIGHAGAYFNVKVVGLTPDEVATLEQQDA